MKGPFVPVCDVLTMVRAEFGRELGHRDAAHISDNSLFQMQESSLFLIINHVTNF